MDSPVPDGALPPPTPEDARATSPGRSFPIVGIGASAGGLEAVSALLRALPQNPGMAFVLVQHLDPKHESSLVALLDHVSAMPVLEAADGMVVEVDHVYVLPPNATIVLRQGTLGLLPRVSTREPPHPIDQFLRSLANERQQQSIAVILSGTGSDGTVGMETVKAAGGITFAQDGTAAHAGMPQSAVAAGCVDFVLPPAGIAEELLRLGSHPLVRQAVADRSATPPTSEGPALAALYLLLRGVYGVDFSQYKQTTIRRRIDRRLVVHRLDQLSDYVKRLHEDPAEAEALFQDLLIHVTSFFRDAPTFDALSAVVFPALLKDRRSDDPIRVWVPGCSTGEEVYSLAICLLEFLGARPSAIPIKLFGTDLSEAVILRARSGRYPESIASDVTPERLRRFFVRADSGYQISKGVRDLCVFARQDVSRDPPFSNLDLISCRNLLIYLGPVLQKRLLPTFHYALKEGGVLLLGKSETVGSVSELFFALDGRLRIYGRKPGPSRLIFDLVGREQRGDRSVPGAGAPTRAEAGLDVQREADRFVLGKYAPSGVLVDDALEVLQFRGNTGPYLAPAAGTPSHNLLKLVREGLLPDLRTAIEAARQREVEVRRDGLRVQGDGQTVEVNLVVVPIHQPLSHERRFLVLFEEVARPAAVDAGRAPEPPAAAIETGSAAARLARETGLERELGATREYLHEILEEHQASNEELLAANEEILSSNEELQSTNEELQTAKEELQATNEELVTINEELQSRNVEAGQLNNDLSNLLTSVNLPIVMIGRDLRIRRLTPNACKVLNLIPADIGRPITDIHLGVGIPGLEAMVGEVLDTLAVQVREVQDQDGHWYALSIRPYRTHDNRVEGAVIVLADVDAIKRSEQRIREARDFAESIIGAVRQPLVVLDAELRIKTGNRAFLQMFRSASGGGEGRPFCDLEEGRWDRDRLRAQLESVRGSGAPCEGVEADVELPQTGRRNLLLDCRRVHGEPDDRRLLLLAMEDVTDRRQQEAAELALQRTLLDSQRLESLAVLAGGIAHDFNNILAGILGNANLAEIELPDDSPLRPYLKQIQDSSERAAGLCAQMLAFSGKGRALVKRLDLSALVRETSQLLRLSADQRSILSLELASGLPAVMADPIQIRQVLANLVLNASEALGEKGGHIRIATGLMQADRAYLAETYLSPDIAEGEYVYLEVADDGAGMDPAIRARIFDPFFTTKFTGRGLGLAAVLGIVRGHAGAIRIDSAPGCGSTFRVLLPRAEWLPEDRPPPPIEAPAWRGEGTVLVVDDEDVVRAVVSRILESLGFRTMEAQGGREGVEVFRAHADEFRLVLLDLTMPYLSGEETLRELRQIRPDVRVVLMSGYDEQQVVERFAGRGLCGFLPKPFRVRELVSRLRAALGE